MPTFGRPKQVRFAYKNTFHSPRTPALTFETSIPSSAGPITPPLMNHGLAGPYTIAYVPSFPVKTSYYNRPRPHPLLETGAVNWDLRENPSTITRNNYLLSSPLFYEHATTPPLPFISITLLPLPWIIDVHPTNGTYVTLGDVFDSIYRSLRINITTREFNSLPHKQDQYSATRAYEQRYRRLRCASAHDEEKRKGMKRVDFLMGHTKIHSISNTGRRSDEWRLNVS
jgi:hypothetical protein